MKKLLVYGGLALIIFGAVTGGVHAAPMPAPPSDYREECNNEGCSNHEIEELWDSMQHECFAEGCWYEEVRELAGGDDYVWEMFGAFRTRLGKHVVTPDYKPGSTPTFLDWICTTFGSESPYGGCQFVPQTPPIKW